MDWKAEAIRLKCKDGKTWPEVYAAFPGEHPDKIRAAIRRSAEYKIKEPTTYLNDEVFKLIEKGKAPAEICGALSISERILTAIVEDYRENGFEITELNGVLKLCKDVVCEPEEHECDWQGNKIIRFGVASDKHLNSKWQQRTHLNTFYRICKAEGVPVIYDPGDMDEGVNMRQGHEYEVFTHGADEHVDYIVNHHPDDVPTEFITGNHDWSLIKCAGMDIGKAIAQKRKDMKYLGKGSARIKLTPNCSVDLVHPLDGAAYALSYAIQKYIDSLSGGEKPNILLLGHHHKAMYLPMYRNIHAFECGTFQAQTPWMKGKRLAAHVGGWIVEVHVDSEGTITRCKGEFIPFYKTIENDY